MLASIWIFFYYFSFSNPFRTSAWRPVCCLDYVCWCFLDDSYHSCWSAMIKNATDLNSTFMSYMQQSSWGTLPKLPNISLAGVFTNRVLFGQREVREILIGWRPLFSFYGLLTVLFGWLSLTVDLRSLHWTVVDIAVSLAPTGLIGPALLFLQTVFGRIPWYYIVIFFLMFFKLNPGL